MEESEDSGQEEQKVDGDNLALANRSLHPYLVANLTLAAKTTAGRKRPCTVADAEGGFQGIVRHAHERKDSVSGRAGVEGACQGSVTQRVPQHQHADVWLG